MKIFYLIFIGSLITSSPPACGGPSAADFTREFSDSAKILPQALISLGYTTFGELSLPALLAKEVDVKLSLVEEIDFVQPVAAGLDGKRSSAQWRRGPLGPSIELSLENWPTVAASTRPVLALHEYFGALNIVDDTNYIASTAIWLLSQNRLTQRLQPNELATIGERVSAQVTGGGGVTGVGGGGDGFGAEDKMQRLQTTLDAVFQASDPDQRSEAFGRLMQQFDVNTETEQWGQHQQFRTF